MIAFLHEYQNLTGSRLGCGIGECRACVVLVDDASGSKEMRTCITGAHYFDGKSVRTIEGIARAANAKGAAAAGTAAPAPAGAPRKVIPLAPVQQKYLEHFSFQCGYCTPGFVIGATALLERLARNPIASADVEKTISDALGTHLCRCTGYVRYFSAVKDVILNTPGYTTKG
ncbi:(2Fe-2S)-binding protein [Diaphorobacter aerolatus]|uniref:(2Fe-2S)-binding protein n=2 Tax=Diaphorobacter aerolatus TaxID=1288495 RepID=A0A7H0GQ88_9BURK|nr:(2Fe-2S)-binding protein [Diaphorobacter aerolatus]